MSATRRLAAVLAADVAGLRDRCLRISGRITNMAKLERMKRMTRSRPFGTLANDLVISFMGESAAR
jgi:hypothetical protein